MIDLNNKITKLDLKPIIIFKLQKLKYTELGHLVTASYSELFYTHIFTNSELEEIQKALNKQGMDFMNEINLSKILYLKKEIIKFNLNEYQKHLHEAHLKSYDKTQIEPLMYSDSLYIVKFLYYIYKELNFLNKKTFQADSKMALNSFLQNHPNMTIADFVDLKPNSVDGDTIKIISAILELPLNYELPHSLMIDRENQIFNHENVQSSMVQAYEYIASLDDEALEDYLKQEKEPQYIKKLTK